MSFEKTLSGISARPSIAYGGSAKIISNFSLHISRKSKTLCLTTVRLFIPNFAAWDFMKLAWRGSISTQYTIEAPREANSYEIAPVPPKRSRTFSPSISYSLFSTLKSPSLAKSVVGRALYPCGGRMFFPLSFPPMILIIL